jgi:hypothetical protein
MSKKTKWKVCHENGSHDCKFTHSDGGRRFIVKCARCDQYSLVTDHADKPVTVTLISDRKAKKLQASFNPYTGDHD